jgi:hypothetical protein
MAIPLRVVGGQLVQLLGDGPKLVAMRLGDDHKPTSPQTVHGVADGGDLLGGP